MPIKQWILHRQISLSELSLPPFFIHVGVYYGVCFLLSGAMLDVIFTYGGSTIWVCTIAALWSLPMQAYVQLGDCHWPTPGRYPVDGPSKALSRGSLLLLN